MRPWFVYILRCADGRLYTGITTDIERRINEHNDPGSKIGAKFTRDLQPVTLLYQQQLDDRSAATRREMEIKALRKKQKLALIKDPEFNLLNLQKP